MTKFLDGPAAGVVLQLRRSPRFLRVVHDAGYSAAVCKKGRQEWDALDQLSDVPVLREQIFVYVLVVREGGMCLDWTDKQGRRRGSMFQIATYRHLAEQPDETITRDTSAWQNWCENRASLITAPTPGGD